MDFIYPATIEEEDGFFTVSFRDLPHALTDGATYEEALEEAVDCLGEALASCIIDNEDLPTPSAATNDEVLIAPPVLIAAKAALYIATQEAGLSKTTLARKLGVSEAVGRRLINPRYQSKINNIEKAMAVTGRRMVIGFA